MKMSHKSCIVLAGGFGTRLRSAVPSLPKCLAPIAGQPFLRLQIESLAQRGVENFVLSLGVGFKQVLEAIQESWAKEFNIQYVIEDEALGTGGATRFSMIKSNLNEALVVNGDTFLGGSLDAMFVPLDLEGGELMRIAAVSVQDRGRFGGIEIDEDSHVVNFLEKGQASSGQINAGLYRIGIEAFANLSSSVFSLETEVMPRLVVRRNLQARELAGPFIDIGVPDDYYLFSGLHQSYVDCK
jgi:D-glycero-alpha-D-manno-heptose 1-phosphate guanylyltransferase